MLKPNLPARPEPEEPCSEHTETWGNLDCVCPLDSKGGSGSRATLVSHFRTKVPDLKTDPRPELPRAAAGGDARG